MHIFGLQKETGVPVLNTDVGQFDTLCEDSTNQKYSKRPIKIKLKLDLNHCGADQIAEYKWV